MRLTRKASLIGAICGGLAVGIPTAMTASTASASLLNPCPAIYYEEPFNTTYAVPQGCPPNAATQRLLEQGGQVAPPRTPAPGTTFPGTPEATPPLPETVRPAIASVTPTAGRVSLQLVNDTGTIVTYQAIGFTEQRVLRGGESVTLRDLQTPITLTMVRNDGGFITVVPLAAQEAGLLSVSLNRAADLGQNQRTLNIQPDGQVFAY
ncbi:hypothetical protein C7B76_31210 [filamentous cyanobacterium CCP2]|nr:hypothetical protein C7B76_31210 [filamentous cyanobacterium CCP2]